VRTQQTCKRHTQTSKQIDFGKRIKAQVYGFLWETYHKAKERHLPYGVTQYYLPHDTG